MSIEQDCARILEVAQKELGVHETPGEASTPRIIEYAKHTTLKATSDEVAWCSAFANFVVDTAGFKGTNSAAARSWLSWGQPPTKPIPGCIVVIDRHDPNNPNAAHVSFLQKDNGNGTIACIGGNQSDRVKVSNYSKSKVLGYRVPA